MEGHSIEISASIIQGARGGSHVNTRHRRGWLNSHPIGFLPCSPLKPNSSHVNMVSSLYLNGLPFTQDKHVQHVHIRILLEDVGLGMMLEVPMVPPVGGGTLWEKKCG